MKLVNRLRRFAHRKVAARELAEELRFHRAMTEVRLEREGLSAREARDAAARSLGNVTLALEDSRGIWNIGWLESLAQDFRYALRILSRNPAFAVAIILALALGIGVNVTTFSVVDALLFRYPAGISHPARLMTLAYSNGVGSSGNINYDDYAQLAASLHSLDITASTSGLTDFGGGEDAKEVRLTYVTDSYFHVLGTPLLAGREFTEQEWHRQQPGSVAIISYGFWKSALHGDPNVLGRSGWIGGNQYTFVGIAPANFNGTESTTNDVWLPFGAAFGPNGSPWFATFARVRDGHSLPEARSEANSLWLACCNRSLKSGFAVVLDPYFASRRAQMSDNARVSLWLAATSLIVLLIACANVANLLLVRLLQRGHELAVRMQLGASRLRLISHAFTEILLLGAMSGVAAFIAARLLAPLSRDYLLSKSFDEHNFSDWHMFAFALLFTLFASIVVGAIIASRASRPNIARALKLAGRSSSGERWPLRSALLVGQVALTLTLSVGASLFIHSLRNVHAIKLGYDPGHILVATMHLQSAGFRQEDTDAAYERLAERVGTIPGVVQTALASVPPLVGGSFGSFSLTPGDAVRAGKTGFSPRYTFVSPEYFSTLGMTVSEGRTFSTSDADAPVVVIDELLARELWPDSTAIGKCILMYRGKTCQSVIGVVSAVKDRGVTADGFCRGCDPGELYFALSGAPHVSAAFSTANHRIRYGADGLVIRTSGKAEAAAAQILRALQEASPGNRYVNLRQLSDLVDMSIRTWTTGSSMFSFFSALALALTAIGIYGLLAYSVRQRTPEIGVRMALGAQARNVLRLFLAQTLKLVTIGIVIGAIAAFALSRLIASLLFQVNPGDFASYFAAATVLLAVAMVACFLPAFRATRIDPMVALRYE